MHRFSPNPNLAHLIPWFEWENEAFAKARAENKPVMLFLAAFWCRYCQRMDEQAFSDRENLALLNAYFVALRVEDAKRPDIDARYNLNGWPTVAFFTPAGELLAAANYLPSRGVQRTAAQCLHRLSGKKRRRADRPMLRMTTKPWQRFRPNLSALGCRAERDRSLNY